MKIENKPMVPRAAMDSETFHEFIKTVGMLAVGTSFTVPKMDSNYRMTLTVAGHLLNRKFATKTEGKMVRVGRVS